MSLISFNFDCFDSASTCNLLNLFIKSKDYKKEIWDEIKDLVGAFL